MIISSLQEFYHTCTKNKPLLAIDYGSKKTGIAISTPNLTISMPIDTIFCFNDKDKMDYIIKLIKYRDVCGIVIGLPLNMDATKSEQTLIVEKFGKKLSICIAIPIFMQDERLTSKLSNNLLKPLNIKRKVRNKLDDAVSASLILDTVLKSIQNL